MEVLQVAVLIYVLVFSVYCNEGRIQRLDVNTNVCERSMFGGFLKCIWLGKGMYTVEDVGPTRVLQMSKMTCGSSLIINHLQNLQKVEIITGDIPCENVIFPDSVSSALVVYVGGKRFVSTVHTMHTKKISPLHTLF